MDGAAMIRPAPSLSAPLSGVTPGGRTASTSSLASVDEARRQAPEVVGRAFEEMFATLLLKQMRQTLEAGSMFAGDSSDVLGGMFDHYLGQHIANSGGFGISAMIRMQMERQSARTSST